MWVRLPPGLPIKAALCGYFYLKNIMSNIFLCSDHHFGHANILTFLDADGNKVRNFNSVEEMDERMVENHNLVVMPKDKVYFLGDVAFNKANLAIVARLNGEKVLIKGNHDQEKLSEYQKYFKDGRGSHQFSGLLFTHIPVHVDSLSRWIANVHGHLHTNEVMLRGFGNKPVEPDPRYFSVCMERIAYIPISLEEAKKQIKNRLEASIDF